MLTSHQRDKEDCTAAETISCPQTPPTILSIKMSTLFPHSIKPTNPQSDIICTQITQIGQQSALSPPLLAKQRMTQSVNLKIRLALMFDLQLRRLKARDDSHPLHNLHPGQDENCTPYWVKAVLQC